MGSPGAGSRPTGGRAERGREPDMRSARGCDGACGPGPHGSLPVLPPMRMAQRTQTPPREPRQPARLTAMLVKDDGPVKGPTDQGGR